MTVTAHGCRSICWPRTCGRKIGRRTSLPFPAANILSCRKRKDQHQGWGKKAGMAAQARLPAAGVCSPRHTLPATTGCKILNNLSGQVSLIGDIEFVFCIFSSSKTGTSKKSDIYNPELMASVPSIRYAGGFIRWKMLLY